MGREPEAEWGVQEWRVPRAPALTPALLFCRVFKKASPNGKVRGTWRGKPWGHKHGWEWGLGTSLNPNSTLCTVCLIILPGWQEGKLRHRGAGSGAFPRSGVKQTGFGVLGCR